MIETTTELSQDAITTVREFLAALEVEAIDEAMELADPGIVWRNTTLPTVHGARRVRKILEPMQRFSIGFEAKIHNIAANGNVVLTERTDILKVGRFHVAFWVCGTFELHDGKITVWHDHFSWESTLRGTLVGAAKAVLPGR